MDDQHIGMQDTEQGMEPTNPFNVTKETNNICSDNNPFNNSNSQAISPQADQLSDFDPFATTPSKGPANEDTTHSANHFDNNGTDPFMINQPGMETKSALGDSGFASTHQDAHFGGFDFQPNGQNGDKIDNNDQETNLNPFADNVSNHSVVTSSQVNLETEKTCHENKILNNEQLLDNDQLQSNVSNDSSPLVDVAPSSSNPMTDSMYGGVIDDTNEGQNIDINMDGHGETEHITEPPAYQSNEHIYENVENTIEQSSPKHEPEPEQQQHRVPDVLNGIGEADMKTQPDPMSLSMYDEKLEEESQGESHDNGNEQQSPLKAEQSPMVDEPKDDVHDDIHQEESHSYERNEEPLVVEEEMETSKKAGELFSVDPTSYDSSPSIEIPPVQSNPMTDSLYGDLGGGGGLVHDNQQAADEIKVEHTEENQSAPCNLGIETDESRPTDDEIIGKEESQFAGSNNQIVENIEQRSPVDASNEVPQGSYGEVQGNQEVAETTELSGKAVEAWDNGFDDNITEEQNARHQDVIEESAFSEDSSKQMEPEIATTPPVEQMPETLQQPENNQLHESEQVELNSRETSLDEAYKGFETAGSPTKEQPTISPDMTHESTSLPEPEKDVAQSISETKPETNADLVTAEPILEDSTTGTQASQEHKLAPSPENEDKVQVETSHEHSAVLNEAKEDGTNIDKIPSDVPEHAFIPLGEAKKEDVKEVKPSEQKEKKEPEKKITPPTKIASKKTPDNRPKSTSARLSSKAKTNLSAEPSKDRKPLPKDQTPSKPDDAKKLPRTSRPMATKTASTGESPRERTLKKPALPAEARRPSPRRPTKASTLCASAPAKAPAASPRGPAGAPPRAPVTGVRAPAKKPATTAAAKTSSTASPKPKEAVSSPRQSSATAKRPSPASKTTPRTTPTAKPAATPPKTGAVSKPAGSIGVTGSPRVARSKIGSLDNAKHTPGGGNVKVPSVKKDFSNVTSRCGSMDNTKHKAKGGDKKIPQQKLEWKTQSKVGSLDNAKHKPKGGEKKIESQKLNWTTSSKVGSLDNARHKAGGGDKKIEDRKLDWKVSSKVGSLDNARHKAGGGAKKVRMSSMGMDIMDEKIENHKLEWTTESKIGSLENAQHKPGGGDKKIENKKLDFKEKAASKVGSLDNADHKPGGGDKKIETQKIDIKAQSKVGSLDNAAHVPKGGDKKIESHKLHFAETAQSRTDHGHRTSESSSDHPVSPQPHPDEPSALSGQPEVAASQQDDALSGQPESPEEGQQAPDFGMGYEGHPQQMIDPTG